MLLDNNGNQLPLTGVKVNAELIECFGKVKVSQNYVNPTSELLEVGYIFPLTTRDSIVDFSIKINGTRELTGVLKSKYTASEDYESAVENKQVACYLEKQSNGTYMVKVGNIEPGCEITVNFTYITCLEHLDGKYMFVLPTNIAPKYHISCMQEVEESEEPEHSSDKEIFHSLDIDINWQSKGVIQKIESYTHQNFCIIEGTDTSKHVTVNILPLDGDFNLAMTTSVDSYPIVYKHKTESEDYLMVVNKISESEFESNRETEYYFLVDRSGSMIGEKMKKTNEALEYFLRSIRFGGTYFNIMNFGGKFEYLYPEPLEYNDQNMQNAVKSVTNYSKNMGGTELLDALKDILSKKTTRRCCYFLLTDGEVSDTMSLIKLIKKKMKFGDRFFTLGIGSDVDRVLVEGIAKAGRGMYTLVSDTKDLKKTVIQLLEESCKDYLDEIKYFSTRNGKEDDLEFMTNESYLNASSTHIAVTKASNLSGIMMSAKQGSSGNVITKYLDLNCTSTDSDLLPKIYGKYLLEKLKDNKETVDASLKYGLLCEETAFIVVDKAQVTSKELETLTYNVPHYHNNYYEESFDEPLGYGPKSLIYTEPSERICKSMFTMQKCTKNNDGLLSRFQSMLSNIYKPQKVSSNMIQQKCIYNIKDESSDKMDIEVESPDIINFQKAGGDFNVDSKLLNLLGVSEEHVKDISDKLAISPELVVHIILIKFFTTRNETSEKLILKKLTTYVLTIVKDSGKLDEYVRMV